MLLKTLLKFRYKGKQLKPTSVSLSISSSSMAHVFLFNFQAAEAGDQIRVGRGQLKRSLA
jgi:hypothetical protein